VSAVDVPDTRGGILHIVNCVGMRVAPMRGMSMMVVLVFGGVVLALIAPIDLYALMAIGVCPVLAVTVVMVNTGRTLVI